MVMKVPEREEAIIRAEDPGIVAEIVRRTIEETYPRYYPEGAVEFFLKLHSLEKIQSDMETEEIYLLMQKDRIVGTGTVRGNDIRRLFVLPQYQGRGYGSRLCDFLEKKVLEDFPAIHVDASFPAEGMYLKRGYQILTYEKFQTDNGDFLCYHIMEKQR